VAPRHDCFDFACIRLPVFFVHAIHPQGAGP
jgi:hypothetical protein